LGCSDAADITLLVGGGEWTESRRAELDGLSGQKIFKIVERSAVKPGERIFRSRFVDSTKSNGLRKSRLVAQNFRDKAAEAIPTRSPTVTRAAQRVTLSFAASRKATNVAYIRDVSQAYTQSQEPLDRRVFLEPPIEMNLPKDKLLLCIRPLYGIPESGLLWFLTYTAHHKDVLGMTQCRADKCLMVKSEGTGGSIVCLQVDDSLGTATADFMALEEEKINAFRAKPRQTVAVGQTVLFNGMHISNTPYGFLLAQTDKVSNLQIAEREDDLISSRAAMQYISTCTRPDLSAPCQLLASKVRNADISVYKAMNALVGIGHDTAKEGLRFVKLDESTLRIVVMCDASFANADGCKSQLGFVVLLVDGQNRANIVHYGSQRCTRVTRSVMAAELHGLIVGYDNAIFVSEMVSLILGRHVDIVVMLDSKTVFDTVTRLSNTLEKRLQIDAYALQEAHRSGELTELVWIPSHENCADALTKTPWQPDSALRKLMSSNQLRVTPTGWCHRIKRN
jgi:hypothetical protein